MLNGRTKIQIYNQPYSSELTRYYESSNSATLHLNNGDFVTIGSCYYSTAELYEYSSFSGYLVKAD